MHRKPAQSTTPPPRVEVRRRLSPAGPYPGIVVQLGVLLLLAAAAFDATDDPHRLMSPREVAAFTSVNAATLRRWREENKGPHSFKLRGRIAFRRSDVIAWLEAQEAATARGDGVDAEAAS